MVVGVPDPFVPDTNGSTPLDQDELTELRPSWARTRGDLNRAEAEAIAATQRTFARRVPPLEVILDDLWLRRLHERMFGAVWGWAGSYRDTERSLGRPPLTWGRSLKLPSDQVRRRYIAALRNADAGNLDPLVEFVTA